jgi:hypothetical protein
MMNTYREEIHMGNVTGDLVDEVDATPPLWVVVTGSDRMHGQIK